ncbi:plasmodesmata-located protein 6-like isoform X3 [Dioscorea cayenensis subsp. rotundata]|uniref:Plasmodesmata-located protein 6-like isoform X3 n=1 Tax=Dioscorea cayennensis subsp. rotundata TaxID=55577 RepID=A0AB40CYN7_DIOCR|nr:plasmodesmata-located protein 6-like isoform X3 [Dioscorea cayenensis subsp. rotundata]
MATNHLHPLLLLLLLTALPPPSLSDDPTAFVYAGCSQLKYTPGSPYEFNVDSILSSISTSSPLTSFSNFTASNASPSSPAYGLYQCRGDLSLSDCQSCIHSSLSQLSALCPSAVGAALQLQGCYFRYGNESFLGVLDTTLVYKKCGQALSINGVYDPNMLSMREAALSQLQQGGGGGGFPVSSSYRTGGAVNFQAISQCVGDINAKECGDCVSAAIVQLKSSCSFAVSGDVYLGKCYARFWSSGDYGRMSNGGGGGGIGGGGGGGGANDDASKNWAIVIGIVAGVILIIVFLSFIRKSASGGKK